MSPLELLAREVGVSERTLRRAVAQGTLRASRPSPRKMEISVTERQYARRSWPIISVLRSALRTEQNVRLAVLFGSCALGTDGPDSDVDVLVELRDSDLLHLIDLKTRLTDLVGRPIDLVVLEQAEQEPSFLAQVLAEGRVLADRDNRWPSLCTRQGRVRHRGTAVEVLRITKALAGIDRMLGR